MLFEQKVKLEPVEHRYFDRNGIEYKSWSHLIRMLEPEFDKQMISKNVAKSEGVSQAVILERWDVKQKFAANHGTRVHNALERYDLDGSVLPEDTELIPMLRSVSSEYVGYKKVYNELCMYHTNALVAGTADKVLCESTHKDCPIDLADYKTNVEKGIQFTSKYRKYLAWPLDHLQHCNYNTYSLQLSAYAYMLELLTKRRIGRLFIHYIPYDNPLAHQKIPVPYMKEEVKLLFMSYMKRELKGQTDVATF